MSTTTNTQQKSFVSKLSTNKLLRTSALTAAGLMVFALPAHADRTDPTGGTVTHGSSTTTAVGGGFVTNDTTNVVVTEYDKSILIKNGETWTINQLNSDSISAHRVLNKDTFNTLINGSINANGNFILIDPNGILVGQNGSIDANSVILTTGDISDTELLNNQFGQYTITDATDGVVEIRGSVTVAEAGLAAFVAPTVVNSGIINAKLGNVVFASGEVVTLDLYGDKLVEIEVSGDVSDAILQSNGEINAKGGVVQMTADQAKDAVDNIINVGGIVNVASATVKGGKIVLSGGDKGTVRVNGELKAAGVEAGDIEVSGENVKITQNAVLNTNGRNGTGGGDISLVAINELRFRGKAFAKGDNLGGNGGSIVMTGDSGRIDGDINASAVLGDNGSLTINGGNTCITSGPACSGLATGDTLSVIKSSIENPLNRGTDVTVTAQAENGDLSVRDNIDTATASIATLSLLANDDVTINGNITDTGAGLNLLLTAGAGDVAGGTQSDVIINGDITTNGGDVTATADRNIDLNSLIDTDGGSVTLNATGLYDGGTSAIRVSSTGAVDTSNPDFLITEILDPNQPIIQVGNGLILPNRILVLVEGPGGKIALNAQDIDIDPSASIDAGNGTISITRSTEGTIGLGDAAGDMRLSQRELDTLSASKLEIGHTDEASSKTTDINVDTVDLTSISEVELNALAPAGGINFLGLSSFDGLTVNGTTTNVNSAVTANAIEFNSDIVNLDADLISDNISGSSETINIVGSTNGAEIQDGIDIAGTDATVNLAAGTYIENITIDKEGLDLIGANGATIQAAIAGQSIVTVAAKDVTIDPITFDGAGIVDYGIYADGVGASGLLVDGNTFRNFNEAGIFVQNEAAGGTTTISNNIFEGSSRTGVETGRFDGGATLDILNNTFGSIAARIRHGILFGRIDNATVNVTNGATHSTRDAIRFNNGLRSGANVTLTNLTLDSRDREAVEVNSTIRTGSSLTISGGTLSGGDNGIKINNVAGTLNVQNATITGGENGILFDGEVRNGAQVTIDGNSVTAADDAIKFDDPIEGAGTVVTISNNTDLIGGDNGILFNGEIRDGAVVNVTGNTNIEGQTLDGIVAKDDIDGATLNISGNAITGLENGIAAENFNLENGAAINITNNASINGTNGEAVIIDDSVQGGVALTISGNLNITAGTDGIAVVDVLDAQILNNTVTSAGDDAIDLKNSDSSDVLGNTLSGFTNDGIQADLSDDIIVAGGNTITGGRTGVRISNSDRAEVNANTISDVTGSAGGGVGDGINISNSDDVTVDGNTITNVGDDAINVERNSDDATITNNNIDGAGDSGIAVFINSQNPFIQDNVINNTRDGVFIDGTGGIAIDGAEVDDNDITNTRNNGVWLRNTTNASVTDNVINSATGAGVRLTNSSDAVIGGDDAPNRNTVHNRISNVVNAVIVQNSNNVVVGQNDVTSVTNGITISGGDTITVEDNNMTGSGIGVDVNGTTNAIIGGSASNGNELDNFNIGIRVAGSENAQISHNQINVNGNTSDSTVGIQINGGNSVDVDQNRIDDTTVAAIQANNTTFIDIDDNVITDAADGIYVTGGVNADIRRNNVNGATDDGIQVISHNNVDIENNIVANADDSGITVTGSNNADIISNNVDDVRNGVRVNGGSDVEIRSNQIDDASNAGITVRNNNDAQIANNQINVNGNSTNSAIGIEVNGGTSVDIDNNRVDDTRGGTSILVTNAPFVDVDGNVITDSSNGIVVTGGRNAEIRDNQLNNISNVAIDVTNNNDAQILRNLINVGGNAIASATGIRVNGGNSVDVDNNRIDDTTGSAIEALNTTFIDIDDNIITDAQDGIFVSGGQNADIRRNNINDANDDGIQVSNHDNVDIENNIITDVIDAGITVLNGSDNARIIENNINDATNGIRVTGGTDAEIRGNETDNVFRASNIAISVTDNNNAQILNNQVNVNGNFRPSSVGIQITGGDNVDVIGNRVDDTGTSILANNTTGIDIDNNVITDTLNGIVVNGGSDANIRDNQIDNALLTAIDVNNNNNAEILRNLINTNGNVFTAATGIRINGGDNVDVIGNTIDDTRGSAVLALNTTNVEIDTNIVTDANDGIFVSGGSNATVNENNVSRASDDGIQIDNSTDATVTSNIVADIDDAGIAIVNNSDNATVRLNVVSDASDGIRITNSDDATVARNNASDNRSDGIDANNADNLTLNRNRTNRNGDNGIEISNSDNVELNRNTTNRNDDDGIDVKDSTNITLTNNRANRNFDDGIDADRSDNVTIQGNTANRNASDGLSIDGSTNVTVDTVNTFSNNGEDGIKVGQNASDITITDNIVENNGNAGINIIDTDDFTVSTNTVNGNDVGIELTRATNGELSTNTIDGSLTTGIEVNESDAINVLGNTISNSGVQGFHAQGALNGDIVLAENTFTDNDLGALFESGNIDLTGGANSFIGGTDGMRFAPVGAPTDVTLVGNTFGTTIFSGQTDNYIELANGALFAPGSPTILDATNVNFDGIIPSSFPTNGLGQPILPPGILQAIEDKLFDFDNLATLGQIFVGVDLTLTNFEDFIRAFDPAALDASAVNVTLLGLPRLSIDANALANIAPAAGEGVEGSDVASIEPAAGGENVNCWSDAVGGSAEVSTFTFGGTFADSIAAEGAGCKGQEL